MCNKEKYDKKTAKTVLNHCRNNKRKNYRNECRIYECDICKAWHLTSEEEYFEKDYLSLEELQLKEEWVKLMKKGE